LRNCSWKWLKMPSLMSLTSSRNLPSFSIQWIETCHPFPVVDESAEESCIHIFFLHPFYSSFLPIYTTKTSRIRIQDTNQVKIHYKAKIHYKPKYKGYK
jgi:hypothetical protein